MIRPILRYGDSVLHQRARSVDALTPDVEALIADMIDTMYAAPGVGLAAPQVGVSLRIFVVDVSVGRDPAGLIVMINPEFIERDGMQLEEEGCLSVPGFNATVVRPTRAVIKGLDRQGDVQQLEGNGLLARAFQHEMDHLDGTLFVDRLRGIKRDLIVSQNPQAVAFGQMVEAGLRIVFFGTPDFAVPTLDALLRSCHQVVGVVTQPDRPRGRGQKTTDSPVKARASAVGVPVFQPDRLKDEAFVTAMHALSADLGVVAAYGKILPDWLLAAPRRGMVNVHASLLPKYRGAAPVHRAVIAGETETGVTIMRVVKALDAGPMLATVPRRIARNETSAAVERDLAHLGATLLVSVVDRLAVGNVDGIPQDEAAATYAHRLTKSDGLVDWTKTGFEVQNLIRGLHPWPHAYTFLHGRRFIVLQAAVAASDDGGAPPGTIVEAQGDELIVATGEGWLRVLEIQAEGKRPMTPREFLAGHPLQPGDRFQSIPTSA